MGCTQSEGETLLAAKKTVHLMAERGERERERERERESSGQQHTVLHVVQLLQYNSQKTRTGWHTHSPLDHRKCSTVVTT